MARPKEFDYNRVLDKAIEVFWCRGYEATSMQDLVNHMAINRQSIYDTFGDKHALFESALYRYIEVNTTSMIELLGKSDSVKVAIRQIFESILEESAEIQQRGCLVTNTAVELAQLDKGVTEKVEANLADFEAALETALKRAQARGEIRPELDPKALARFFVNSRQGLRVTSKVNKEQAVLRDIINVTLSVLD